jgi:hypothetical protein
VQQQPLLRAGADDRRDGAALVGRQAGPLPAGPDGQVDRRAAADLVGDRHEAAPLERAQPGKVVSREARQRRRGASPAAA